MKSIESHSSPVLRFLRCRTPARWLDAAESDIDTLLLDHAALELKAAQQGQRLVWKYSLSGSSLSDGIRASLANRMSRLAREELRHFEQVLQIIQSRGIAMRSISASRYAAGLHEHMRADEPCRLVDTLIVGAIIEARSCERFEALQTRLDDSEPALAKFYRSLLRSESRHFNDYLQLAERVADEAIETAVDKFLTLEQGLIESADTQFRFHSGVPAAISMSGLPNRKARLPVQYRNGQFKCRDSNRR